VFRVCKRSRTRTSGVRHRRHRVDYETVVNGRPRSRLRKGVGGGRRGFFKVGRVPTVLAEGIREVVSARTSSGESKETVRSD